MDKVPVTAAGLKRLEEELKHLKSVERPQVIDDIATARAHGDLKENAEYHAARERQGFIEARIKDLESATSRAEVIDPSKMEGKTVKFGATVTILDEDTEKKFVYQIVGEYEANIETGLLSCKAPIARALIGKNEGDSVEVPSPSGEKFYEILNVQYK